MNDWPYPILHPPSSHPETQTYTPLPLAHTFAHRRRPCCLHGLYPTVHGPRSTRGLPTSRSHGSPPSRPSFPPIVSPTGSLYARSTYFTLTPPARPYLRLHPPLTHASIRIHPDPLMHPSGPTRQQPDNAVPTRLFTHPRASRMLIK